MPFELILFDIDGTLIEQSPVSFQCFVRALRLVCPGGMIGDRVSLSGKTDPQIMREMMNSCGVEKNQIDYSMDLALNKYVEFLSTEIPNFKIQPCKGVRSLLKTLKKKNSPVIGLLTGNLEPNASKKLQAAGIPVDSFVMGAFGSDDEDRNKLPAIAISRAEKLLGKEFNKNSVLIIGDTPKDIECARVNGLKALAVATGKFTYSDLLSENPDFLLEDFSDIASFLKILDVDNEAK